MSVTDGSLTTDGAQQTVRIAGTVTTTASGGGGTQPVSGAVQILGADNATKATVTGGNLFTQFVNTTIGANQGTAAALASAWPIKITDANQNVPNVAVPGPNLGGQLLVSNGSLISFTTVNAATGAITGTAADFGSSHANFTAVIVPGTGVNAGVLQLQLSQDNTNWMNEGTASTALAAGVNQSLKATGVAYRYARVVSTTNVAGGNVTVTLMAT